MDIRICEFQSDTMLDSNFEDEISLRMVDCENPNLN